MNTLWTLASVTFVSLVSLAGLTALSFGEQALRTSIAYFVSFAAGALLGNAFLHLLPAALQTPNVTMMAILSTTLGGILLFFVIETMLHWHHCTIFGECPRKKIHGIMNLIGDGVHNFIDGIAIAGSFLISIPLGITTTLAVALHEIPQEISDFGILINAGFSVRKALLLNFASALAAIAGSSIVLVLQTSLESYKGNLIALAAGGLIYIAGSDLLPQLPSKSMRENIVQFFFVLAGVGVMVSLGRLG